MVRPKKSTFFPQLLFSMGSFNPAFWMVSWWSAVQAYLRQLRCHPSWSNCPNWSALMNGSKYLRIKFEKADRDLFRSCVSHRHAKTFCWQCKCEHFYWSLVWRFWAVISLGTVKFTKYCFPCGILCCGCYCADWVIVVYVVVWHQLIDLS